MTQDTRKDRRVKIVSLNVRYKSATVDEFIENHAHDVSRGGIFIKTGNPFPPGTLLKFEIRLASDQALIAGVGRIVWKRDAGTATAERPGGMGVKFIKIDEPSKVVIDRLMNTKTDAGRAFESSDDIAAEPQNPAAARTVPPERSRTPALGTARAESADHAAAPPSFPTATGSGAARKSTMLGLGATSSPPGPMNPPAEGSAAVHPSVVEASSSPRSPGSGAMFPKADPDEPLPPQEERTVMRQAAELLEDALREAGGSMAEIGTNPLFSGGGESPRPRASELQTPATPASEWTAADTPQALAATVAAIREEASAHEASAKRRSDSPRVSRETPTSVRPASVGAQSRAPAVAPRKKGSGGVAVLAVAVLALLVGAVVFREQLFGPGAPAEPVAAPAASEPARPTAMAPAEPVAASAASEPARPTAMAPASATAASPPAAASVVPTAAASAAPPASQTPTGSASPPTWSAAAPSASASAAASAAETAKAPWAAPPRLRPAARPPTTEGSQGSTAIRVEPTAPAAPAPPKAAPAPKPAKPTDDNPY